MSRSSSWVLVAALFVTAAVAVGQPPPPDIPKQPPAPLTGVKQKTQFSNSVQNYYGVVEKIDGRTVTAKCRRGTGDDAKSRTFEAVDVLADGGVQEWARGATTYLWTDMKKGDTVTLGIVHDDGEDKDYCVELIIYRRPGGKVPASSKPESDESRLAQTNVLNDIENGLDVDDDEISTVFPPSRKIICGKPAYPGGLSKEWQDKLDAIRAKKAKDKDGPKAKPPEPEKK